MEEISIIKEVGKRKYSRGASSLETRTRVINAFHKEVVRQILLGNKVNLPSGMSVEIIRYVNYTTKVQPRLGFVYKVRFICDKIKIKGVKLTLSSELDKKINSVLRNTDFEYKLVDNGFM